MTRDQKVGVRIGEIYGGDSLLVMRGWPSDCVHCCITSPPYYGLRDYQVAGQIGAEDSPEAYIAKMVEVFREVRRVLHPSGVLWLNLGDSYNYAGRKGSGALVGYLQGTHRASANGVNRGRATSDALKPKDMMGIPFRVAFALQEDGWYLRSIVPWLKRNAMPSSVKDRPPTSTEYVFLLSKSEHYYYDSEAVKIEGAPYRIKVPDGWDTEPGSHGAYHRKGRENGATKDEVRSSRSWRDSDPFFASWQGLYDEGDGPLALVVNTVGSKGAHFATFPEKLVEPLVLTGTSEEGVCTACGEPWVRLVESTRVATRPVKTTKTEGLDREVFGNRDPARHVTSTTTVGWEPSCACGAAKTKAVVLDPFMGSGTVAVVARRFERDWVGVELSEDYRRLAVARLGEQKWIPFE